MLLKFFFNLPSFENGLIFCLFLKDISIGYSILDWLFFFWALEATILLPRVSERKLLPSDYSTFPLQVRHCSLCFQDLFFLPLVFWTSFSPINVNFFGFILFVIPSASWIFRFVNFWPIEIFSPIISSNIFQPTLSYSRTSVTQDPLLQSQQGLKLCSLLIFFFPSV